MILMPCAATGAATAKHRIAATTTRVTTLIGCTLLTHFRTAEGNLAQIGRQITAILCLCAVAGCTNPFAGLEKPRGKIGYVQGAIGAISVDEPQAALIGRDVLSSGGSAADAATAMAFALSVTMPSSASLGGGGVCIARDANKGLPVVIDFLPRAPKTVPPDATRPSAVPGMARGLVMLHSRFGKLKWEQVLIPAENLARFGYQVPRAFASEFDKVADAVLEDATAAAVFRRTDGRPVAEGGTLSQPELAAVIGRLRKNGAGDFYVSADARKFVDAVNNAGGSLTVEDLRDYLPEVRKPISFPWRDNTAWHFAGPPSAGGAVAAEMTAILLDGVRFENSDRADRLHLIAEAAKRAFVHRMQYMQTDGNYTRHPREFVNEDAADDALDSIDDARSTPLTSLISAPKDWPETPSAVSLVAMDAEGGSVACTLTMNNSFGTGRMVPGFGVMLAAVPDTRGRTYTPLGPALLASENRNQSILAIAASGGVTAPTAMANVLANAVYEPQTLREAMHAPRIHYGGVPDKVFVETDMQNDIVEDLRKRGHNVALTGPLGRVAAVYCKTGIPPERGEPFCVSATDPRGYGVAVGGN
jgi:gamma-glutamyltranspeptidase/glutathione hydrolase